MTKGLHLSESLPPSITLFTCCYGTLCCLAHGCSSSTTAHWPLARTALDQCGELLTLTHLSDLMSVCTYVRTTQSHKPCQDYNTTIKPWKWACIYVRTSLFKPHYIQLTHCISISASMNCLLHKQNVTFSRTSFSGQAALRTPLQRRQSTVPRCVKTISEIRHAIASVVYVGRFHCLCRLSDKGHVLTR